MMLALGIFALFVGFLMLGLCRERWLIWAGAGLALAGAGLAALALALAPPAPPGTHYSTPRATPLR
jgi:hypothetical protein